MYFQSKKIVKVAFVANTCWNIYNFRKGLVHHFLNQGNEVLVLAPRDEYTSALEEWGIRFLETPIEGTSSNPLKDLRYLLRIHQIFKSEEPQAALCFTIKSNIYASLAGRLSRVKTICNVSGLGTAFLVKGIVGRIAITLYRFAFRYSNQIFFQNESDRDLFISRIPVRRERIEVLPGSGINLSEFSPLPLPKRKSTKFLMISRLIIEKGVREYAEAAGKLTSEDVSFTLMGRLDESHARSVSAAEVNQWKEAGLTYLPHSSQVKEIVADHDVVVLPSYREGTARTLLEAAALSRPILTSDVPGCREVVREGKNGFLFKAGDSKDLENKCRLFLSLSHEERSQLAANSRDLVEEIYDEKLVIDKYMDALRRIGVLP